MVPSRVKISALAFCFLATFSASAQSVEKKPFDTRFNVLFGLSQPLVADGFNLEADVFYKRLAFDFSHGVSLDFSGKGVTGAVARQKLAVHIPYTTGFGIGYRFTKAFNVRIEPKWHQFEIYYDGEAQTNANRITRYNTFSLGIGAYYCWLPFSNKSNALKGIMISPSVRFWPTVSSSLSDDKIVYTNKMTGKQETHERMQPGITNTPLVINVSVGYSFIVKKKKIMSLKLKSVVFKTNDLKKTREFFIHQLDVKVSESSMEHFVIHLKNIRVLFILSAEDLSTELYFSQATSRSTTPTIQKLIQLTDPNGIQITIT